MSSQTGCLTKILFLTCCSALIPVAVLAQNTPSSLMQINGNAAPDASYPTLCYYGSSSTLAACDTWNLLNGTGKPVNADGTGAGSSAGHSLVRTFVDGTASTDSYTGGGSKDPNDVSQWRWSGSPTPNKDTFNSGYGAAYVAPNTHFELMFGADRATASGDANVGIWFFQNAISLNSNGTFSGVHKNGDIFVISAYTQGGSVPNIQILSWDSTCLSGSSKATPGQCADSNLRLLVQQAASTSCASSPYCAATNATSTAASWSSGGLAANLFFQGGIDLTTALGGGALPCFSSFLEETRSSQSTSAVLKDFLLGGFPVCSLNISKSCGTMTDTIQGNGYPAPYLTADGTGVVYTWVGSVTNSGVGTLSNVEVDDTMPGSSTAVKLNTLSATTLAPGASATFTASVTLNALTATNTATAKGFFGTTEIDSKGAPASAQCSITPSGSLSVVKHCVAPGPGLTCTAAGGCVVQVPISAHVCNQGLIKVVNIGLTDDPTVSLATIPSLDPKGTVVNNVSTDCADVSGSYTPTSHNTLTDDGATNGRYTFTDTISVTSATPAITGATLTKAAGCNGAYACAPVTCPLCSTGECSGTLP